MNRRRKSSGNPSIDDPHYTNDATGYKNKNLIHQRNPFVSVSSLIILLLSASILLAWYTSMNHRHGQLRANLLDETIKTATSTMYDESNDHHIHNTISKKGDGRTIFSLKDVSAFERHPEATSTRHTVTPPKDEIPITLVTCETTKGFLHIIVHPSWAPLGAFRFLHMVSTKYFSSKVAMMRCIKNFLCQFGIAGDPSFNKEYIGPSNNLIDDPNWLPEGPTHRTNELGVKRFGKGYLAYAGGGENSRSNQLIVALADNERLGGGSPWEVPWGEVVGQESFDTLDQIYTGYGENGPSQGRLKREGSSDAIASEFPNLDYILNCEAVDSEK